MSEGIVRPIALFHGHAKSLSGYPEAPVVASRGLAQEEFNLSLLTGVLYAAIIAAYIPVARAVLAHARIHASQMERDGCHLNSNPLGSFCSGEGR